MALTQALANMVLGGRGNERQMVFGIPAGNTGEDPGILCLESTNAGGTSFGKVYLWADSSNNLRFASTIPTDENSSGSVLGITVGGGANGTLSNLSAPTSINLSLLPNEDITLNVGSAAAQWHNVYTENLVLYSNAYFTGTSGKATLTGQLSIASSAAATTPGILITASSTTATQLKVVGPASQTTAQVYLDGATGNWLGATNVGMLHITGDGTLAHANASLCYIYHNGTTAAAAVGSCLRINDAATAGDGDSVVAYITSASQNVLKLVTATVTTTALQLDCATAQTAPVFKIVSNGYIGANNVGMAQIDGSGVILAGGNILRITSSGANAAASYVVEIASSGNVVDSTNGICLRVDETGAKAGTSYAGYFTSVGNIALGAESGATGVTPFVVTSYAASTVANTSIAGGAWVGANGVGLLHIAGSGTLAHANASLVYIANSGATATAGLGSSLRIVDSSTAGAGGYVAYINSTTNSLLGLVLATTTTKNQLYISGPASQAAAYVNVSGTFVGATGVGMIHLANSGTHAHANASMLYITKTGSSVAANLGSCLKIVDADGASSGGYVAHLSSTNNSLLCLAGTATAKTPLTVTVGANTASAVSVSGTYVGATGVGLVHIAGSGNLAHTNATVLYVEQTTGTIQNATLGCCARFVDTTAAATTSAAVQITSTNNRALVCTLGQADFIKGLSTMCATTDVNNTTPTAATLITAFGAANTHTAGFIGTVNDAGGGDNFFLVGSDGASYFFTLMTKAS